MSFNYDLKIFDQLVYDVSDENGLYDKKLYLTSYDLSSKMSPFLLYKIKIMTDILKLTFDNLTFIKVWKLLFKLFVEQLEYRINLFSDIYKDKYYYNKTIVVTTVDLFYDKYFDLFPFFEDPDLRDRVEDGEVFNSFSDLPEYVRLFYLKLRTTVIEFVADIKIDFNDLNYDFYKFAFYNETHNVFVINRLITDLLSNIFILKDPPTINY